MTKISLELLSQNHKTVTDSQKMLAYKFISFEIPKLEVIYYAMRDDEYLYKHTLSLKLRTNSRALYMPDNCSSTDLCLDL